MGGFAAGLAGAIGDHLHEQHLLNLQQQVESKRNLLDNYKTLLSDPHMADVHGDIVKKLLQAAGTDATKLHKIISKPGNEYDPQPWQAQANQRQQGVIPSPVNQGQNPTQIPAAPVQHDGTPGGQSQIAPPWNSAASQSQTPPGGMSAGDGADAGMSIPLPPDVAQASANQAAQSVQQLPNTPGGPPPGSEVVGPSQASVISPPPAPSFQYGPMGSLPQEELNRRHIALKSQEDEAQQQAEMRRMNAVEGFKRNAERQTRLQQVADLKADGTWDKLTDRERAAIRSGVTTLGNTPRAMPAINKVPNSSAPPGTLGPDGQPLPEGGMSTVKHNPATGEMEWWPIADQAVAHKFEWGMDPQNPQKSILYRVDNAGNKTVVDDISKINPAMIPLNRSVNSTTDASGHTVGTTTSGRSLSSVPATGAGSSPSIPPPPGRTSGTPSGAPGAGGGGNPIIKRYAEDLRDGKNPVIPPKDRDAVTSYMVKNNIASPTPLSAKGAGDLQAIDPVISQVDDLLKRLQKTKDDGNPLSLVKDYLAYKHGFSTSNSDLFTNLSFEQLRSAAAALKGTNARAYPILQRAFEHTPTLERMGGLNPDSPKAIFGKLVEMKKLLQQGRNSILADEKKSGIPGVADNGIPAPPAGGGSTLDDLINKYK